MARNSRRDEYDRRLTLGDAVDIELRVDDHPDIGYANLESENGDVTDATAFATHENTGVTETGGEITGARTVTYRFNPDEPGVYSLGLEIELADGQQLTTPPGEQTTVWVGR